MNIILFLWMVVIYETITKICRKVIDIYPFQPLRICLNDLVLSLICLFIFFARLVLIGFNISIFSGSGETWPAEWYFEQLQQQWHPRYANPPQTRTAHYPGKPVRDRTSLEFCGGKCLGKNCYYGVFDDVIKMYITIILGTKKNNFLFLFSTNLLQ